MGSDKLTMKTALKILAFVALMGIYSYFFGAPAWHTNFGIKLSVVYGLGAVMAWWFGGERIGTLDPISLRSMFVVLGVILMLAMFIVMVGTRDTARRPLEIHGSAPTKSLRAPRDGRASSASRFALAGPACLGSGLGGTTHSGYNT